MLTLLALIACTFSACNDDLSANEIKIEKHDVDATHGNAEGDPDGGDGGYGGG
ncbi:hypothetical protein C7460_104113 [Marinoscillum furvescens DSM 4134]|uniref:Uncharacterized protein n=2 Tax=Marinoscillum furvescens TaxID=1026 RepID=A0A3D9L4Z5_MARFU|nr:hypothetical protein C7460_104113 [Marinoscillum furvescens DSM 4134]